MKKYLPYLRNRAYMESLVVSLLMFAISLAANFYSGLYATEKASNSVTDIILNNIPVFNVQFLFIYGSVLFWIVVVFIIVLKPRTIPFTLKTLALFILIRSVFVSLTHIGPFPEHAFIPPGNIIKDFSAGGDLFFSGHTGLPFLLALIFWDVQKLRVAFVLSSILFGVVVLLGHLHYSIDVLAAFFITYTIHDMAEFLFPHDRVVFRKGIISA